MLYFQVSETKYADYPKVEDTEFTPDEQEMTPFQNLNL